MWGGVDEGGKKRLKNAKENREAGGNQAGTAYVKGAVLKMTKLSLTNSRGKKEPGPTHENKSRVKKRKGSFKRESKKTRKKRCCR